MNYLAETIEWIAVITALIYVYLASKANRICFVFGLISSAILVYICLSDHLYFDTFINAYYVVMSVVGWYSWNGEESGPKIRILHKKAFVLLLLSGLLLSLALAFVVDTYTSASMAYIDSFTTVFAVLATWMLVERYIENWLVWIVADAVAIYLYLVKGHYPIALLFGVYTIIAIYGYVNWKKMEIKVL